MAVGLDRIVQEDFSAGMFRGVREDLIPATGVYDITNGLLDNVGAIYKRGGSSYRSTAAFGSWIPMVWDGWLGATQRTVIASPTAFGLLNADGSVTSLGGGGLSAPGRPAVLGSLLHFPGGSMYDGATMGTAAKVGSYYAAAANRLFVGTGNRIDFSAIYSAGGTPTFAGTDYHLLPDGVQIIGMQGLRNALAVFTTGGVWIISNVSFNLTDSAGNVQHRVDKYSSDLVLWGDAGIAAYEGGLVAPAMDGVWLLSLGIDSEARVPFARISDPIERLYRGYVDAGCQPGQACAFNGHYFLPILNGSQPVDLLVCRLNTPARPWSRMSGFGAQVASLTVRTSALSPRSPQLIGGSASTGRVLNLNYFQPLVANALDADASTFPWSVQPRDIPTGKLNLNTIAEVRIGYDMASAGGSAPAITATQFSGRQGVGGTLWGGFSWGGSNWSSGAAPMTPLSGSAPVDPVGSSPYRWPVGKRERFARFRFDQAQAAAYLTLRWVDVRIRSSGRV